MMERRGFIGALAASLIVKTGGRDEWIVVADGNLNLNRRRYDAEAIQRMAHASKGMLVLLDDHGPVDGGSLLNAVGVCVEARVVRSQLQCRFEWFSASEGRHIGKHVTPSGMAGNLAPTLGGHDVKDYRLTSFALSAQSAFTAATKVRA